MSKRSSREEMVHSSLIRRSEKDVNAVVAMVSKIN